MAYAREAAGFGGQSGVLGNVVWVQTEGGTIVRGRPSAPRRRTPGQIAQGRRLEACNAAWRGLTREEADRWQTYRLERAAATPTGSRKRMASAQSLFSGLGSKYLQMHGGREVPRVPPTGRFLGDAIRVTAEGVADGLRFVADGANREGVLTELLAQPLTCAHGLPRPRSYVSLGFAAMAAGAPVEFPVRFAEHWACAVRFVEAATGRATEIVEIGTATVGIA